MKIITKVCIIVSGVFLVIGVICLSVGAAMGVTPSQLLYHNINFGNFFTNSTSTPLESDSLSETHTFTDIKSLDFDLSLCELTIYQHESDDLLFTADNTSFYFSCTQEDEQLIIKDNRPASTVQDSMKQALKLTLYLSPEEIEDIDINIGAGEITIEKISAEHIKFNCGVGDFQAEEFFCEDLGLSCGVGEIKIARLFCEDTAIIETGTGNILLDQYQGPSLDINSGVGETTITVAGDETDYNYTLNASLGEIYLNHHHFSKSHDSDFAACLEKDYNADQDIQIQNALGNINLTFMEESL